MKNILLNTLYFILLASPVYASSVTVCNSGCTYTTIAAALTGVGSGTNTITVQGTYTGNEVVTVSQSGTSDVNRLVLTTSGTQTIKNVTISGNYVTVNGFTITGSTLTGSNAYAELTGSYNTLSNNHINPNGTEGYTVLGLNGSTIYISHPVISGNTIVGPATDSGGNIFRLYAINGQLLNNSSTGETADFCYIFGHDNLLQGNYWAMAPVTGANNHPDFFQTYEDADSYAYNITVDRNFSIGGEAQPCNLSSDGLTASHDWTFTNNVFINFAGACNVGIPNVSFYNNTFYNCNYDNADVEIGYMNKSGFVSGGGTLKNNIFISNYGTGGYAIDAGISFSSTPDYNYIATTSWGTKTGHSEAHGVNGGNPYLVNAGGTTAASYNLTSPSTILIGKALNEYSLFTTDYAGNTRPVSSVWDIGAYEYIPQSVSLTSINSGMALNMPTMSGEGNLTLGSFSLGVLLNSLVPNLIAGLWYITSQRN